MQLYSKLANLSNSVHKLLMALRNAEPRKHVEAPVPIRKSRHLREHEVDLLVSRYHSVRNMRKVGEEFKITARTVAKHLSDRGVHVSRSMSPSQVQMAKELYAQGLSSAAVGKQLGFDNKTVLKALRS